MMTGVEPYFSGPVGIPLVTIFSFWIQTFLVDFLDCVLSCRFGNFLCNSEKERQESGTSDACGCIWMYMANLRAEDGSHVHFNVVYDPLKHDGPLLPRAAALAPMIWPQFHLRWACPSESQAGELEAQLRIMKKKYAEMTKSKEMAETMAKDLKSNMESLATELQKEKQISHSAIAMSKRACRETQAIKRAIQSLGCKIQFLGKGNRIMDSGSTILEKREESPLLIRRDSDAGGQQDESADFSVSISSMEGSMVADNPISRVCEGLCPYRTREGCKWPDAACAQLGSQFVGFKANFDAFDRLSIYDCYFGSE